MARAVRWSGRARADLRSAVEHINRESQLSAKRFLEKSLEAARSLAESSERGARVAELQDPDIRQVHVGRYRILYEVQPNTVWIIRVLHGSRDVLLALGRRTREDAEKAQE